MFNYRFEDGKVPIIFIKNNTNFVDMQILFRSGSANENKDSYGIAHFLEHMHFQGTNKKNKKQLAVDMNTYGNFNAETWFFHTSYYFNCVKDNFLKCFDLQMDIVFDSIFPEEEFKKEKQVVTEELDMYFNEQDSVFSNLIFSTTFSEEMHDIIGTHESIKQFNFQKLIDYKNNFYNNKNCYIIVSGNLDFEELIRLIDNRIPQLPDAVLSNKTFTKTSTDNNVSFVVDSFDQSAFCVMTPWVLSRNDKNKNSYFFSKCLNQYFYDILRDDMGLCYGISNDTVGDKNSNNAFFTMLTNSTKLDQAHDGFNLIFNKIKNEGFKDEVLNMAKHQYLTTRASLIDNSSSICSAMANRVISASCDEDITSMNLDIYTPDNKQLIEFANQYLNDLYEYRMVC